MFIKRFLRGASGVEEIQKGLIKRGNGIILVKQRRIIIMLNKSTNL
jgi:hypothetical protein